jgi:sec-independent protein translocase protein TatA
MPNIGPMELLLLGILAVVIFGPAKLPEIGRSIGRATRDFKDAISGTGIDDAIQGVGDVRSAMSPTNIAKAAMPASVKDMASDVTDMKKTLKDPLGMKGDDADTKDGEAKDKPEAAATPAAGAPPSSETPTATTVPPATAVDA